MRTPVSASVATLLLLGALGCDGHGWSGPLATAAESVFISIPMAGCDTASAARGFADVRLPLRSCEVVRGDTTFTVVSDRSGKSLIVSRMFLVDPSRRDAIHDSLQFAIADKYGAPVICPPGGDPSGVRLWNTLDRQLVLMDRGADQMRFEVRVDHPSCDRGAGGGR